MSKIENLTVGSTTYDITPDSVSVKDIRDIAGAPSAFTAREVSPFFTNQGMPTSAWHAGINVCGWSGDYNQWQLVGYANETDADNSLYFRNGSTSNNSWYPWRTILDSKNYTNYAVPNNHLDTYIRWVDYDNHATLYIDDGSYSGVSISTGDGGHLTVANETGSIYQMQIHPTMIRVTGDHYPQDDFFLTDFYSADYTFPAWGGEINVLNTITAIVHPYYDNWNTDGQPSATTSAAVAIAIERGKSIRLRLFNSGDGAGTFDDIILSPTYGDYMEGSYEAYRLSRCCTDYSGVEWDMYLGTDDTYRCILFITCWGITSSYDQVLNIQLMGDSQFKLLGYEGDIANFDVNGGGGQYTLSLVDINDVKHSSISTYQINRLFQ